MIRSFTAVAAVAAFAGLASAQVRLSEIGLNPPGTDQGQEFIELIGTAGLDLTGLTLLIIEGDGAASGVVDQAISLSGFSLGSNGLFLHRDTSAVLDADGLTAGVQGPSSGTTLRTQDFIPDIENGTNTYLLVSGFTGALNADLDTNNDGVLDSTPWASLLDGIGFSDDTGGDFAYAGGLGFFNFGVTPDVIGGTYSGDALVRGTNGLWYVFDVNQIVPGEAYFADQNEITVQGGGLTTLPVGFDFLTPGRANVVPTPGSLALAGIAGLVAVRRRRA